MQLVFLLFIACAVLSCVHAAYCNGKPASGERVNAYPTFEGRIRYKKSIKNAMLYEAGPLNATFPIVHVWGTPYEVGFAQGTLRKQEIKEFVFKTWGYLSTMVTPSFSFHLFFRENL